MAKLEAVGQPPDERFGFRGPRCQGKDLGYRSGRIIAGNLEEVARQPQGLGRLARPGRPDDDELLARLRIGSLDRERPPGRAGGLGVGETDQLRSVPQVEVHLGGVLEGSLETVHDPLGPHALQKGRPGPPREPNRPDRCRSRVAPAVEPADCARGGRCHRR